MTNYEKPSEVDSFRIIAALSNLLIAGVGFAFYGDVKRFVKYLLIGVIGGILTFGVIYLLVSFVATVKVWNQV